MNNAVNTAKDIITNDGVLQLFREASSTSQLMYICLTIVVICLLGGLIALFVSLRNNHQISKAFLKSSNEMKDVFKLMGEKLVAYTTTSDLLCRNILDNIENQGDNVQKNTTLFLSRLDRSETLTLDELRLIIQKLDDISAHLKTMYTYCTAKKED